MPSHGRPPIRIVLLGCGNVGAVLLKQILRVRALGAAGPLIAAVADSGTLVRAGTNFEHDLDAGTLQAIIAAKLPAAGAPRRGLGACVKAAAPGADPSARTAVSEPLDHGLAALQQAAASGALRRVVVADCSAAADTGPFLAALLAMGCGVVLANKKPLSESFELYRRFMTFPHRFRYESTVGAGLPVHATLSRLLHAADVPQRIAGAFSGTLGFVMSGLEAGKPLSAVVREAKALGYTEPDPRDDLCGADVARKALILARRCGMPLRGLQDVPTESLFPAALATMPLDQFMAAGLDGLDADMAARVAAAATRNAVLRYGALVENGSCKVGLMEVPRDSPLGRLTGTDNLCEIASACFSPTPLVLQGRGAGAEVTAAGVLADVGELAACLE